MLFKVKSRNCRYFKLFYVDVDVDLKKYLLLRIVKAVHRFFLMKWATYVGALVMWRATAPSTSIVLMHLRTRQ